MEVDAGGTSTSVEYLKWDAITVLGVPCQLHNSLYAFDDLPLDHSCKRYPRVQVNCCCTQALVLETILDIAGEVSTELSQPRIGEETR